MKAVRYFTVSLISLAAAFWVHEFADVTTSATDADSPMNDKADDNGIAVVELFTSEGCSSCPSADRVLTELDQAASKRKRRVFCLGFHVDYWNRLGWKDRFSDKAYTRRQRIYVAAMKLRSAYTPQMIVNGRTQFVGSNRRLAHKAVSDALTKKPTVDVGIQLRQTKKSGPLEVSYQVERRIRDWVVNVALVESGLSSRVTRGENRGRTLTHTNTVRVYRLQDLNDRNGKIRFSLPADLKPANARVIVWVQHSRTLHIVGAAASKPLDEAIRRR